MSEDVTRRSMLRGAGAVGAAAAAAATAAACGSASPSTTATSAAAATTAASPTAATSGAASGTTVAKADVPVGGGKIVAGAVVTQPTSGTFKAFSSVCTHQGCNVAEVTANKILCKCHGSSFDATTGAVTTGPATRPLAAKTLTDSGSNIVLS